MQFQCENRSITDHSKKGDSISVNGVCQTITDIKDAFFSFQTIQDTLQQTNLGQLQPGSRVNLEMAATPDTRLGGHWVNGHVDLTLPILKIELYQPAYIILDIPENYSYYCIHKGSITLDGVGLTIQSVTKNQIRVGLITHTITNTTLAERKTGDPINIEFDILGKYVVEYLRKMQNQSRNEAGLTEKLRQAGFI